MDHPIKPPPELVRKWIEDWAGAQLKGPVSDAHLVVADQAARWGADQRLHAVLTWLRVNCYNGLADDLLAAMRPKPPSLKEQALEAFEELIHGVNNVDVAIIRRALNELPNE